MKNLFVLIVFLLTTFAFRSTSNLQIVEHEKEVHFATNEGLNYITFQKADTLIKNFKNNPTFSGQNNAFYLSKSFLKSIPANNNDEGVEFIFGKTAKAIMLYLVPARFNGGDPVLYNETLVWVPTQNSQRFSLLQNSRVFSDEANDFKFVNNLKRNFLETPLEMKSFFVGKKLLHKIIFPIKGKINSGIKIFLAQSDTNNIDVIFQATDNEKPPYQLSTDKAYKIYSCIYKDFSRYNFGEGEDGTIKPCPKYCGN